MKKMILLFSLLVTGIFLSSCNGINMIINGKQTNVTGGGQLYHVHDYSETVVSPTCEEEGYTIYTCECGNTFNGNKKKALGHDEKIIPMVEETCTESGLTEGKVCNRCDKVLVRQEVIPAQHKLEYYVDKAPTCEEDGTSSGAYCKRCTYTVGTPEVLPKLGHNYQSTNKTNSFGDTYKEYKCTRCVSKYMGSLTIDYESNYDYMKLKTSASYSQFKSLSEQLYQKFYNDCMEILSSTKDYSNTDTYKYKDENGVEHTVPYCLVSKFSFTTEAFKDAANNVAQSFITNNPEFYFLDNTCFTSSVSTLMSTTYSVTITMNPAYFSHEVRELANRNIKEMEKEISLRYVAEAPSNDIEKAKLIHDYIIEKIDYQLDSNGEASEEVWAHNIMGVADNDNETGGVCECYAKTYLYLSRLLNLNSIIIKGFGNGGGHAWNYTCINGIWYGTDVTWDDQTSIIYKYFLASKSIMEENHQVGPANITLDSGYFQVEAPTLSQTSGY